MHEVPYPWYSLRGKMEDVSKEQILLGRHDVDHNESTQKVYGVKQLHRRKTSQTIWIMILPWWSPWKTWQKPVTVHLCLLAQERQRCSLGRVVLGNCVGEHSRCRSTPGSPRSGRVGVIFPLKTKCTEEDYITQPVSPTCLDKEAKYLKCLFLG